MIEYIRLLKNFFYKNKDCKISGLRHNCKDCSAQAFSNYYANNKNKIINNVRDRKELIKKATPSWADLFKINEIYNKCPIGFHVDHIVPLQGKNVSGLHIEYNLQYLLAKDNIEKSNKWEVS